MQFLENLLFWGDCGDWMKKTGHLLVELSPAIPRPVVEKLQAQHSITTAEEFIGLYQATGDRLRVALDVGPDEWQQIIKEARASVSPEELIQLESPVVLKQGKGAILSKKPVIPEWLRAKTGG